MARPQVADGGDALHIWRVAANILNNQSRAADKGWPSSWGLGVGLTILHRKKKLVAKILKILRTWTDYLDKHIWLSLSILWIMSLKEVGPYSR
jgi:hypothetical protein